MSRLALVLALLSLSQMVTGSARAEAEPSSTATTRYRVESVSAQWVMPRKATGEFDWVEVRVVRRTDLESDEVRVFGTAGVGDCVTDRDGSVGCGAELRALRVDKFEADPLFRTVKVVLRGGKKRHNVTWTSDHPYALIPPGTAYTEACPYGEGGAFAKAYVIAQEATARGRVFGRRVSTASEPDEHREPEDMTQSIEIKNCREP